MVGAFLLLNGFTQRRREAEAQKNAQTCGPHLPDWSHSGGVEHRWTQMEKRDVFFRYAILVTVCSYSLACCKYDVPIHFLLPGLYSKISLCKSNRRFCRVTILCNQVAGIPCQAISSISRWAPFAKSIILLNSTKWSAFFSPIYGCFWECNFKSANLQQTFTALTKNWFITPTTQRDLKANAKKDMFATIVLCLLKYKYNRLKYF